MFPTLPVSSSALTGRHQESVKLWEAVPGHHRGTTVSVSSQLMQELHTAQDVINAVKENLAYGAGNLKNDFMLTAGESYQRSIAARHIRDNDYRGDDNGLAKAAIAVRSGACSEYSAVAMAYLSNMDLARPVFTYAAANDTDHQFNVIGDLREPQRAVVVDAWPTFAKAHLLGNASFQPQPGSVLDVHYPGMRPKVELSELAEVQPVTAERIARVNQMLDTPQYQEVISQRREIGLRTQTHGLQNLAVSYRNQDDATDVLRNTVSRDDYERQAHAAQQAQRYLPD